MWESVLCRVLLRHEAQKANLRVQVLKLLTLDNKALLVRDGNLCLVQKEKERNKQKIKTVNNVLLSEGRVLLLRLCERDLN